MPRVDAVHKVRGATLYTADETPPPGTLHAAWVGSQVARGSIRTTNFDEIGRMPGVSLVLSHCNMPRLAPPPQTGKPGWFGEATAPMQDAEVRYFGQPVAAVLAGTPEQADHAARAVRIGYDTEPPVLDLAGEQVWLERFGAEIELQVRRGDPAAALAAAAVGVEHGYETAANHHAAMELPAAVAAWEGDRLDLWITTRGVLQMRTVVSHCFGLPDAQVRVLCRFVGGAFGSKGWLYDHALVTAAAARVAGRPVRLVLTREQTFETQGRRPMTRQTVALGASAAGRLNAIRHETTSQTSMVAQFTELAGTVTPQLYAAPALLVSHGITPANVSSPTPMRGPGDAPGSFALEVAMDELAAELDLDPMELRLRNLPRAGDPESGKPWTSFHLDECWQRGAASFGWAARDPRPGTTRDAGEWVGWGCATAAYPAKRRKAATAATLLPDGTVELRLASHDAGFGTYTALTIVASEALGIAPAQIRVLLGDTEFPEAPVSGGSATLASTGPAVIASCRALQARMAALAAADQESPVANVAAERIVVMGGCIVMAGDAGRGEDWTAPLWRAGLDRVEVLAEAGAGDAKKTHGLYSFGAHFTEVRVHPALCRVRVTRYVGVYDIGRVLAPVQARGQVIGSVLFAFGMALMEHGMHDGNGRLATSDLGSYHVPGCADVPPAFDVEFIDAPDTLFNPLGTRGVGEIGTFGAGAAVANAVYHATGKRVRSLPITAEALLSP